LNEIKLDCRRQSAPHTPSATATPYKYQNGYIRQPQSQISGIQNNVDMLGGVSPTQSASPVPAPPPLPPLARGCSHCRIAASTASLIARSRPDLVTDPVPSTNISMHHGVHHTNYDLAQQTGSFTGEPSG
jgi:hypothetical protein